METTNLPVSKFGLRTSNEPDGVILEQNISCPTSQIMEVDSKFVGIEPSLDNLPNTKSLVWVITDISLIGIAGIYGLAINSFLSSSVISDSICFLAPITYFGKKVICPFANSNIIAFVVKIYQKLGK